MLLSYQQIKMIKDHRHNHLSAYNQAKSKRRSDPWKCKYNGSYIKSTQSPRYPNISRRCFNPRP